MNPEFNAMNLSEAKQIQEKANEINTEIKLTQNADGTYSISVDLYHFYSFKAATCFVNAIIIEKACHNPEDYAAVDLLPIKDDVKKAVITAYDAKNTLKIENKAEILNMPFFLVFTSSANVCKVQNQNYQSMSRIIEKSELDADERPIYLVGIKNYSGYLIAAYDNGKIAKISMSSYQTEFNRKKLKGAFNNEAQLIFIEHIISDTDYAVISSINKVVVFNSSRINAVGSRNTKGIQLMKSKDGSLMTAIKKLDNTSFANPDYYRSENLNVVGYYLKDGDTF